MLTVEVGFLAVAIQMMEDNTSILQYSPKDWHFTFLQRAATSCEEVSNNLGIRPHETGPNTTGQVSELVGNGSLETCGIVRTTTAVTVVHGGDKGGRISLCRRTFD